MEEVLSYAAQGSAVTQAFFVSHVLPSAPASIAVLGVMIVALSQASLRIAERMALTYRGLLICTAKREAYWGVQRVEGVFRESDAWTLDARNEPHLVEVALTHTSELALVAVSPWVYRRCSIGGRMPRNLTRQIRLRAIAFA